MNFSHIRSLNNKYKDNIRIPNTLSYVFDENMNDENMTYCTFY